MPAPDLATLFQFEQQIETATVAVLTAAMQGVQILQERDTAIRSSPYIEVKLQLGAATGQRKALVGAHSNPSQTLPDAFHAQLILTTVTNRKSPNNGARHDELLGKVRVATLLALESINVALAWLTIRSISTAGVIPVAMPDSNLDMSPEVFAIQFCIAPTAWPVLPAAV